MSTVVFSLPEENTNVFKTMVFCQLERKIPGLQIWSKKESFIFFVITKLIHSHKKKTKPQTNNTTRHIPC